VSRRSKYLWLVLIVLAAAPAWWLSASLRGYLAAEFDVNRGRYEVLGYGMPSPLVPEYARVLNERYGIHYRAVSGCIVSASLAWYVDAYDRVSTEAAKRKFGRDVFKEAAEEASRNLQVSPVKDKTHL
jgi:hypothetical protein